MRCRCRNCGPNSYRISSAACAVLLASSLICVATGDAAEPTYLLKPKMESRQPTDVQLRLNVSGQLKAANNGQEAIKLPIEASAELDYMEVSRAFGMGHQDAVRAVRLYERAEVEIEVDGAKNRVQLNDQRRVMVYHGDGARVN